MEQTYSEINQKKSAFAITLYVVLALVILGGIVFFIFSLDRPMSKAEKEEFLSKIEEYKPAEEDRMSQEEKDEFLAKIQEYQASQENSMTQEEKDEFLAKIQEYKP
jgi:flagellar biosynthesis/type III secretory pathway M-ring protein FliF/YscJ